MPAPWWCHHESTTLTCLLLPPALQSNSHLWRVNASALVYLYGTLHVPYPQLWDSIPENVKVAFTSSTDFYLELDTSQSEVMQKVQKLRLLPEGQTLRDVVSRELYIRVEGYIHRLQPLLRRWILREAGLFGGFYVDQTVHSILGEWRRMRPVWLLNLLNSLTEQQVVGGGSRPLLDIFLRQAAAGMGKQVHALESVEDQMEPLNRLSLPEVGTAHVPLHLHFQHSHRIMPNLWSWSLWLYGAISIVCCRWSLLWVHS